MENVPQPMKSKGVSVIVALFGMAITFLGGVYVGIHPNWIPIGSGNNTSEPLPPMTPAATSQPSTSHV
jgi:hypothetical protein